MCPNTTRMISVSGDVCMCPNSTYYLHSVYLLLYGSVIGVTMPAPPGGGGGAGIVL